MNRCNMYFLSHFFIFESQWIGGKLDFNKYGAIFNSHETLIKYAVNKYCTEFFKLVFIPNEQRLSVDSLKKVFNSYVLGVRYCL